MPLTLSGTNGVSGVDGSASTPANRGSDTNTGVVYGTDTVQIATGGTPAVTVDSNQNVGIGTTSPITYGASSKTITLAAPSFPSIGISATSSSTGNKNYRWIARDDANGGPIIQFQTIDDSWGSEQNVWYVSRSTTGISFQSWYSGAAGSNAERMRIDTNGYLLVGYTSSNGAYKLQVNSQIFATSATIATSDARYKENVEPITDGLALVNALNPVSFDWKQHPVHAFDTEQKTVGFLAQEVQTALADKPYVDSIIKESECELPDGTKEKFLGIAEGNMVSILTSAIQELSSKLDAAEARIAALEAK